MFSGFPAIKSVGIFARQSQSISFYFAFSKLGTRPQWYFEIFGSWFFDSLGTSDYIYMYANLKKCQCEEKWDLKNADFWYFADFTVELQYVHFSVFELYLSEQLRILP